MDILDDDFTRESSPEDEAALRKLNIESYDVLKDIRNGRTALLVLAGFAILGIAIGAYRIMKDSAGLEHTDMTAVVIEGIVMLLLYCSAAWLVKNNPKAALSAGLGLFIVYHLFYAVILPGSLFRGILLKLVIIYFLVKAVIAGFKFDKLQEQFRQYGRDLTV